MERIIGKEAETLKNMLMSPSDMDLGISLIKNRLWYSCYPEDIRTVVKLAIKGTKSIDIAKRLFSLYQKITSKFNLQKESIYGD
jgi:hypothetical protein